MDERRTAGAVARQKDAAGNAGQKDPAAEEKALEGRLLRLARMFDEHRENPLMRDLCRLAIKCAREGLTHG